MNRVNRCGIVCGLLMVVLVLGPAAMATTIKSASHYGQDNGFNSCVTSLGNCESFDLTDIQGTVTLDGLVSLNVYRFAFNDGSLGPDGVTPNPTQVLDLINLGSLSANQTITLTSTVFGVADLANALILTCNNGTSSIPVDSNAPPNPVNGVCSPIANATGDYPGLVSNGIVDGKASFTLNSNYNLSDLVLEFQPGSTEIATPEPTSLALLGTGLATLTTFKRRKR